MVFLCFVISLWLGGRFSSHKEFRDFPCIISWVPCAFYFIKILVYNSKGCAFWFRCLRIRILELIKIKWHWSNIPKVLTVKPIILYTVSILHGELAISSLLYSTHYTCSQEQVGASVSTPWNSNKGIIRDLLPIGFCGLCAPYTSQPWSTFSFFFLAFGLGCWSFCSIPFFMVAADWPNVVNPCG